MSDIIQLLPDHVANQIAAGEVVQRPASVVKELLENAIDASATDIQLIVKDAGRTLIQVIDNGIGMSVTDARLCFERHATSKIREANDLFDIKTKGFRGEAMASIAAIAHVELRTQQKNDELGTLIKIEGSKVMSQESVATVTGTSVSVKNLFFNIPARRNFLKSNQVEIRHIINEFQRVALTHPAISFSMYHNESEIYKLPNENLRQRIVNIFGKKMNEKLVPISETTEIVSINGFITKPEFAKKKRGEQFFFVNNRFIKSPYLNHAVTSAFDKLLPNGSYPSYFLYLEVPTQTIDINIHPTKTEIKFDDEKTLYAILKATIKHSLGQYNIAPVLDFERDNSLDTPYELKDKKPSYPTVTVDRNFNPFTNPTPSKPTFNTPSKPFYKKEKQANWEQLYTEVERELPEEKTPLFSEEKTSYKTYQVHQKYIISSIKSGIVCIHQNLAHQRILYEKILKNNTLNNTSSQQLLFPLDIHFSKEELATLKSMQSYLENVGFSFDAFSEEKLVIKGIPQLINESEITFLLEQLLNDLNEDVFEDSFSQIEILAKSMAKSTAIRTGVKLSNEEQEEIVNQLFLCKEPSVSPFGKKVFVTMDISFFDKQF
ncbi:MAG: DNA mismatch repair endonuclease MutL [Flavobacteriaceae bacterium]|nr:DNA mismatch repair endonuclease MutL [Flavobacteriaceae bacterium]